MAREAGGVWAKVYPDAMVLGNGRNLLYNGAMQVAQRGTSVTGVAGGGDGYLTADRWSLAVLDQGTWTVSIENDGPSGSGFTKSYKALCTTGDATTNADDLIILQQMLEGQDLQRIKKGTAEAEQLTFSFWVKTNVSGTQIVNLIDNDNLRQVSASVSLDGSETWQKKVVTFPADTTGAFDNDNNLSLRVRWWLAAGSTYSTGTLPTTWASIGTDSAVGQTNFAAATNNYWQITGVQLEVGDTATDFEHKQFGVELAECQRYYEKSYDANTYPGEAVTAGCWSHTGAVDSIAVTGSWTVPFAVVKRAKPTFTYYSPETGAEGYVTNKVSGSVVDKNVGLGANVGTASIATNIGIGVGIREYLPDDSSYIRFQWTADAEL